MILLKIMVVSNFKLILTIMLKYFFIIFLYISIRLLNIFNINIQQIYIIITSVLYSIFLFNYAIKKSLCTLKFY